MFILHVVDLICNVPIYAVGRNVNGVLHCLLAATYAELYILFCVRLIPWPRSPTKCPNGCRKTRRRSILDCRAIFIIIYPTCCYSIQEMLNLFAYVFSRSGKTSNSACRWWYCSTCCWKWACCSCYRSSCSSWKGLVVQSFFAPIPVLVACSDCSLSYVWFYKLLFITNSLSMEPECLS
jgi:hypothetical protein